jgi:hypothetical protein
VLFGGDWRRHVSSLDNERRRALDTASAEQVPFVEFEGYGNYIEPILSGMGFRTNDTKHAGARGPIYSVRRYSRADGRQLKVVILAEGTLTGLLKDTSALRGVAAAAGADRFIAYSGYSSAMRTLFRAAPGAMRKLGRISAYVDMRALLDACAVP